MLGARPKRKYTSRRTQNKRIRDLIECRSAGNATCGPTTEMCYKLLLSNNLAKCAGAVQVDVASHLWATLARLQFACAASVGAALSAAVLVLKIPGSYELRGFHSTQESIPSSCAARI